MATEEERYEAAKRRVRALRGFYAHLASFVIVNLFLLILNLITTPDTLWFYWATLGWGVGLAFHAATVYGGGRFMGSAWEDQKIRQLMAKDQRTDQ